MLPWEMSWTFHIPTMDALDEPPPPRAIALWASADGAAARKWVLAEANTNGPCKLDRSPQPALAWETNIVHNTPAPRVRVITREFMKFLFLPRESACTVQGAIGNGKLAGEKKIFWGYFQTRVSGLAAELGQKPGAGHFPVPHHGIGGDFYYFSGLFYAQAAEKAELDDAGFAWVDFSQGIESVVESDQFTRFGLGDIQGLGEVERLRLAPALGRQPAARAIEQDPPHQGGRNGEEMGAVLPI